jgi:uncharacterized protein CbrC (UPF0167 family)
VSNWLFKYFQGPPDEMSSRAPGDVPCHFCHQIGEGFDLEYATCASSDRQEGKFGCARCLSEGRFEFWHDTDIGVLDKNGLSHVYKHNGTPPPNFAPQALTELRRTPRIVTWQQELWLTHCDDFMAYIGTWEPKDFVRNSQSGDGRTLFLRMTRDLELRFLWDQCLEPGEMAPGSWHAVYYAFRCLHCGDLAGNWDCD